ncbi:hypothetical protein Slala05_76200 [Streptomyces lavendulae subsp. lavendulae]|nr:hypothetical protein Slala05_76200 [Streptomyces lavendulae subsp. lavendulae]
MPGRKRADAGDAHVEPVTALTGCGPAKGGALEPKLGVAAWITSGSGTTSVDPWQRSPVSQTGIRPQRTVAPP